MVALITLHATVQLQETCYKMLLETPEKHIHNNGLTGNLTLQK